MLQRHPGLWIMGQKIYLTAVKWAQCRMVDDNRREKDETKKESAKKTSIRKAFLHKKRSEYFRRFQDCIYSLSPSPSELTIQIALVPLSAITLKDAFFHLGGKLGDLPNQIRQTVATDIIRCLNVWVWTRVSTTTNIISSLSSLCIPLSKELSRNSDINWGANTQEGST